MDTVPFEVFRKILSYLDLDEVIRSRTVNKLWQAYVDNFVETKLFFSERPMGQIFSKNRLITGVFNRNFIVSSKFEEFFECFSRTIFSGLKHLRIAHLNIEGIWEFTEMINSFGQLEALDLIQIKTKDVNRDTENWLDGERSRVMQFISIKEEISFKVNLSVNFTSSEEEADLNPIQLTLPNLKSIDFDNLKGIHYLKLDTPKLREIRLWKCNTLELKIVSESVERLITDNTSYLKAENLKNLKYYYCSFLPVISPTFLSSLEHLQEIHLDGYIGTYDIHRQRLQCNRPDLKIYYFGLLVDDSSDPINEFGFDRFNRRVVECYVQNEHRLADEVLFYGKLHYSDVECVAPTVPASIWKRFIKMNDIRVNQPVQQWCRFLTFLKNFHNVEALSFSAPQPQQLFDKLPDYCSVQKLKIENGAQDLEFLFELHHLIDLSIDSVIDAQFIHRIFRELKLLLKLRFCVHQSRHTTNDPHVSIEIAPSKLFQVRFGEIRPKNFEHLNDAISFIVTVTTGFRRY